MAIVTHKHSTWYTHYVAYRIEVIVCLFDDLVLYVQSTIFQLYRDGSSWVEPVLS